MNLGWPVVPCFPSSANPHPISLVRLSVRSVHSAFNRALLAAIPLEVVNFWVIGYPAAMHPVSHLSQNPAVALQWYVIHLGGIIVSDHSVYLREHAALDSIVFFIAGYTSSAILLLAILWLAGLVRRTLRKLSSPLKQAA